MGLVERVVDRLKAVAVNEPTSRDRETRELAASGVVPIATTQDRGRVRVQGRVRALTLPTATSATALVVELADHSGPIQLVFVGRKAIPGIECGVVLRAAGRVSMKGTQRVIYNPAYEIVPRRGH